MGSGGVLTVIGSGSGALSGRGPENKKHTRDNENNKDIELVRILTPKTV